MNVNGRRKKNHVSLWNIQRIRCSDMGFSRISAVELKSIRTQTSTPKTREVQPALKQPASQAAQPQYSRIHVQAGHVQGAPVAIPLGPPRQGGSVTPIVFTKPQSPAKAKVDAPKHLEVKVSRSRSGRRRFFLSLSLSLIPKNKSSRKFGTKPSLHYFLIPADRILPLIEYSTICQNV